MGRSQVTRKFEITPEFKELQELARKITFRGGYVSVDPINETVTFLNGQKMNFKDGKQKILELIEVGNTATASKDLVPMPVEQLNKKRKKPRTPGAPLEQRVVLRRSKRIYKKAIIKGLTITQACEKAISYINRKSPLEPTDQTIQTQFTKWAETQ